MAKAKAEALDEMISGTVAYNDLQQFAFLDENNARALLAIDVAPFNSLNPQDARYAHNYLKQKGVATGDVITFQGRRIIISGSRVIMITAPF